MHTDRRKFLTAMAAVSSSLTIRGLSSASGSDVATAGSREKAGGDATGKSAAAVAALARLRGPMASVTIPYNDDGSIDFGALRSWVNFACERGVPILFMTLGDSELEFLDESEIEAVIRTVAKEARGRSLVCGGTGPWATRQIIAFLRRISDSGVDAVSVHFTPRIAAADDVERAFAEISAASATPLLAYEVGGNFTLPLVRSLARLSTVIGMKCHDPLYGFQDYALATRDSQFGVLGAGRMNQFFFGHQCGSPAWLCLLAAFAPEISLRFHQAVLQDDLKTTREILFQYEEPLMASVRGLAFPHVYKSILSIAGHYRTNRMRPPRVAHTELQMAPLKKVLQETFGIGR